jgi:hypothetical protein
MISGDFKQLPKVVMMDLDMLLMVATMVRLTQTWVLLPLLAKCSWTLSGSTEHFRSRYWAFWGVAASVSPHTKAHINDLF